MPALSQNAASQEIYGRRAENYINTWHPQYAERFMELVSPQPGQYILDLCCGTGLGVFSVAEALSKSGNPQDGGIVVGIDSSPEMLSVAKATCLVKPHLRDRIRLIQYDVTDLEGLGEPYVTPKTVDLITCSCAFVLFDNPEAVLRSWRRYLKVPVYSETFQKEHSDLGGTLVVDIPHEAAQRGGAIMERVARKMGLKFPSNRSWVKSADSFRNMLERNGFRVERVVELKEISGTGARTLPLYVAVDIYEALCRTSEFQIMAEGAPTGITKAQVVASGRQLFMEEFLKEADEDGRVYESDSMYVYVARRSS